MPNMQTIDLNKNKISKFFTDVDHIYNNDNKNIDLNILKHRVKCAV